MANHLLFAVVKLAGPGHGPRRPEHCHTDSVVGGEDRDHGPQDETEPSLDDVQDLVMSIACCAGCQAASL